MFISNQKTIKSPLRFLILNYTFLITLQKTWFHLSVFGNCFLVACILAAIGVWRWWYWRCVDVYTHRQTQRPDRDRSKEPEAKAVFGSLAFCKDVSVLSDISCKIKFWTIRNAFYIHGYSVNIFIPVVKALQICLLSLKPNRLV